MRRIVILAMAAVSALAGCGSAVLVEPPVVTGVRWATGTEQQAAARDVNRVLSELERGCYESWDYIALLKKHGRTGAALLVKEARDPTGRRSQALFLLGCLGDANPGVLDVLEECLLDTRAHIRVRCNAARALGKLGEEARALLPLMERLRDDPAWLGKAEEGWYYHLEFAIRQIRKAIPDTLEKEDGND